MTIVEVPRVLDTRGTTYRRVLRADPCAYCPRPGGTTDHITAKSVVGQPEGARNLTGACEADNVAKGATSLLLFLLDVLESGGEVVGGER